MNFNNQKLFIPYKDLILTQKTLEGKNNCFYFYGENVNFIETYNFLTFRRQYIKHVFVPSIMKPRSYLTPEYIKILRDRKLIPIKGRMGEYSKLHNFNFYFDATKYLNVVDKFYKVKRFNTGYGATVYKNYLMSISGIDKENFDTTLLYTVNIDNPIPLKFQYKKSFLLYKMLFENSKGKLELPFEKILMFVFNKDGGKYIKLYDKKAPNNNLGRVKRILMSLQQISDNLTIDDNNSEHISTVAPVESKLVSPKEENIISTAIKNYTKADSSINVNKDYDEKNIDKLITRSVVYNIVGDLEKSKKIANTIDKQTPEKRKEIIKKLSLQIVPRPKAENTSTNLIIKSADVPKILDYQSPEHIFQKRQTDFKENLKTDIVDAFKTLENKDIPLKFKSIDVEKIETGPTEIFKTIKDRYKIKLEDKDGHISDIHIDIPHLTENGSFLVNGQQKILINQLVRFPIFFPSINVARFESSYSVMKINSKELTTGAYLIAFLGSYKVPLLMLLAYKYGLESVLKEYGITYSIN